VPTTQNSRLHGAAPTSVSLMCRAWRVKARKQHREDTSKKDAVERSGAADGGDGRAEAAHLVEIGQVSTNQRAKAAGI
jgi:hypothetical protein